MITKSELLNRDGVEPRDRMAFSIREIGLMTGLSLASLYRLAESGKLRTVPAGIRRRLVSKDELNRFLADGPMEGITR